MREFTEQESVRREKLEKLKELGLDPFGQRFGREDFAKDIGVAFSTVNRWENGKNAPSYKAMKLLNDYYRIIE